MRSHSRWLVGVVFSCLAVVGCRTYVGPTKDNPPPNTGGGGLGVLVVPGPIRMLPAPMKGTPVPGDITEEATKSQLLPPPQVTGRSPGVAHVERRQLDDFTLKAEGIAVNNFCLSESVVEGRGSLQVRASYCNRTPEARSFCVVLVGLNDAKEVLWAGNIEGQAAPDSLGILEPTTIPAPPGALNQTAFLSIRLNGTKGPASTPTKPAAKENLPPELHSLASADNKQQVRVVVLARRVDDRADWGRGLLDVDRDLAERVARHLLELCKLNAENVLIVDPQKVEEYKGAHPTWFQQPPADTGKEFQADYVINLEINNLTLKENTSFGSPYRGQGDLLISLVSVKTTASPERREFSDTFPERGEAIRSDSMPLGQFRALFLDRLARRVAWHFVAHPPETLQKDPPAPLGGK
jgi:hypothetical protein